MSGEFVSSIHSSIASVTSLAGSQAGDAAEHGRSGIGASAILLAAATLGAGIIGLPSATSKIGTVAGAVLLLIMGVGNNYTISLMLEVGRIFRCMKFEQLGGSTFGVWGSRAVSVFLLLNVFGALTAFLDLIADSLVPVLETFISSDFFTARGTVLGMATLFIVYPLCMLRHIHALEKTAGAAVAIVVLLGLLICVDSISAIHYGTIDFGNVKMTIWDSGWFDSFPTIALAYACQMNVFPVWMNMKGSTQTNVGDMKRAVLYTTILCGVLYVAVGVFGYMHYNVNLKGEIIENMPHSAFYNWVRGIFSLAIIFHYPVLHFAFRTSLDELLFPGRPFSWLRSSIETTLAVGASFSMAIAIPNLTKVFNLVGATSSIPLGFILPAVFYLKAYHMYHGSGGQGLVSVMTYDEGLLAPLESDIADHEDGSHYNTGSSAGTAGNMSFDDSLNHNDDGVGKSIDGMGASLLAPDNRMQRVFSKINMIGAVVVLLVAIFACFVSSYFAIKALT